MNCSGSHCFNFIIIPSKGMKLEVELPLSYEASPDPMVVPHEATMVILHWFIVADEAI